MPSALIGVNSAIYKEIVTKGLKASDFKMSSVVTVRNIFSEHDIQMLSVLTVRNIVLSTASGGNRFSKRIPRLPRVCKCCGKGYQWINKGKSKRDTEGNLLPSGNEKGFGTGMRGLPA